MARAKVESVYAREVLGDERLAASRRRSAGCESASCGSHSAARSGGAAAADAG